MKLLKRIILKLVNWGKNCLSLLFYLLPINKNKIVVDNFSGKGYGDNPKYLAKELLKDKKYKIIWLLKDVKTEMPEGIKKVRIYSIKAYYHMITARLWISNIRNSQKPLFKRKNQYYLQTWHGGLPLKKIEKDAEEQLSKTYINASKKDGKMSDYILSSSKLISSIYKNSFWTNAKILEFGIPRNDIFFETKTEAVEALKQKHNLNNKLVVMYAPTFRTSDDFYEKLEFNAISLKTTLEEKFKKEVALCFRAHPNDLGKLDKMNMEGIIDLSHEDDSQVVLMASDFIISDYSSIPFDFIYKYNNKPAILYACDYEEYKATNRKLYTELYEIGLPFYQTFQDMMEGIKNTEINDYIQCNKKALDYFGIIQQPNSSQLIVKYLKDNDVI